VGTSLQSHSGQSGNKSFMRLGYGMPLKVAHFARKTGSGVGLIQMTVDSCSLQTLILLE
jgi:hypothetical protein